MCLLRTSVLVIPVFLFQNSGEDRKKELRKWQKKKREIEELEARQRNCEKLGLDEVMKKIFNIVNSILTFMKGIIA